MEGLEELSPLHSFMPFPGGMDTNRGSFKRAVLRPPPRAFSIEFLPPSYKGSHNHGMRILPVAGEGDSLYTESRSWEYNIWRKWEDVLWFQHALESEYARAAREKKVRLAQGKGVKTLHGIYKQDMASSWESLPPGPLPSSVAQDIHKHIPRLSKKGTLFRASQSTIDQRQTELRSLVETLFSNDMPSLIKELRATHRVTDFFGLWRRDYEEMEKSPQSVPNFVASSVFSSYFSESSPSLSPHKKPRRSSSTSRRTPSGRPRSTGNSSTGSTLKSSRRVSADNLSCGDSMNSNVTAIKRLSASSEESVPVAEVIRPRALSNTSSDSSSTHSDGCSENGSAIGATPTIVEDSPITFDHNPQVPVERCSSILEVLPEEREMLAKSPEMYFESPKSIASPTDRKTNRNWQVLSTPVAKTSFEGNKIVRASWQSFNSIDSRAEAFLDGIGLSLPAIQEQDYRASISTFMTTNSMDAVLPRESSSADDDCSPPKRISNTVSLSEFEIYPTEVDEEASNQNMVPFPSHPSPTNLPHTPTQLPRLTLDFPTTPSRPTFGRNQEGSFFECLPSPTTPDVPASPSTPPLTSGDLLSIKAAHDSSIIMLRVSKDTAFDDIRQRLYNKFVGQEGVPLSKEFAVAMVVPSNTAPSPAKSSSSKLSRSLSLSSVDKVELHFIDSQYDWEQVVLIKESSKVTLKILDAPRV